MGGGCQQATHNRICRRRRPKRAKSALVNRHQAVARNSQSCCIRRNWPRRSRCSKYSLPEPCTRLPRRDSRSCKRSGSECSLRIRHMSQKGWTAGQLNKRGCHKTRQHESGKRIYRSRRGFYFRKHHPSGKKPRNRSCSSPRRRRCMCHSRTRRTRCKPGRLTSDSLCLYRYSRVHTQRLSLNNCSRTPRRSRYSPHCTRWCLVRRLFHYTSRRTHPEDHLWCMPQPHRHRNRSGMPIR